MNFSTDPIRMETWSIDRLIPYARNPRKNDQAVDRMCGSIREFGFKIPCLVRSDGEVIDGHPRLKAARKLGNCARLAEVAPALLRPFGEEVGTTSQVPVLAPLLRLRRK